MKNSQSNRLLEHFKRGGTVTSLEAYQQHGITQLATRISELKDEGHIITGTWIKVTNRFGEECRVKEYSLAQDLKAAA
jgi:hypothetical protein